MREWFTARQIADKGLIGAGKSLRAVTLYIQRQRLSDHPTFCRKAPGEGSTLEYHVSLFSPEARAQRRKQRSQAQHPRRDVAIFETAEGGALMLETRLFLATRRGVSFDDAKVLRERCIARFGQSIMKAHDPAERVRMPPLRAFQHLIKEAYDQHR